MSATRVSGPSAMAKVMMRLSLSKVMPWRTETAASR